MAIANVLLIDLGYNMSVKLFAIHLFLMTVLLMSARLKQITRFLLRTNQRYPIHFKLFLVA